MYSLLGLLVGLAASDLLDCKKYLCLVAGTGKSLLLRAIIATLRKKHAKKQDAVSVTASTGMAASNIGGVTIHSWGAVTPGQHDIDRQIRCIKTCKPALQRWKATKILIIDEGELDWPGVTSN
jgi:PIF1-like helicase